MFGRAAMLTCGLILAAAVLLRSAPLFLLAALVGVAGLAARLGERWCLRGLDYARRPGTRRAFWGEQVPLDATVTNAKLLPVPWLRVLDEAPEALVPAGAGRGSPNIGRAYLEMFFSLGWYERVRRRHVLSCAARGDHVLGPASLEAGDVFGLYSRREDRPLTTRLIVYPRLVPAVFGGPPAARPQGDVRARRALVEDPGRVAGVRDWAPGDPMRLVHWKATARAGRLLVRRSEPVAALQLALFLNVETQGRPWGGYSPSLLELVVMTAAALARDASRRGCEVGLYVNATIPGSGRPVRVPAGSGPRQLREILTGLARANPPGSRPVSELILAEARRLRWGATALLVTCCPTPAAVAALAELKRRGYPAGMVVVAPGGAPVAPGAAPSAAADDEDAAARDEAVARARARGLGVWWVREEGDWREITRIRVEPGA